jgi:chromosome segregation ATPase
LKTKTSIIPNTELSPEPETEPHILSKKWIAKYLYPLITILVILGGTGGYVISLYTDLITTQKALIDSQKIIAEQETNLANKKFEFQELKLKFKEHKHNETLKFSKLNQKIKDKEAVFKTKEDKLANDISKLQEHVLKDVEKKLAVRRKNLIAGEKELTDKEAKLESYGAQLDKLANQLVEERKKVNAERSRYSKNAQKAKVEEKIISLIDDLADLGVDMKKPNWCDEEYTKRYNKGKSIVKQISTLNSIHKINDHYDNFVTSQRRTVFTQSDGECSS